MALPASGQLSFSQINTEFGLGTSMSAYRGATYYIGSTPGTFPSTNLGFTSFYNTGSTSSSQGVFMFTQSSTPFFNAYQWSTSGFGTRYSNPSTTLPGGTNKLAVNTSRTAVLCGHAFSPYIAAYAWSNSSGFGTKYSNPASLASGSTQNGVAFAPDELSVGLAWQASPYIYTWRWTNASGFGTRNSNPGTGALGVGNAITFSQTSGSVLLGQGTTPFLHAWDYTGTSYGTRRAASATSNRFWVEFSASGNDVITAGTGTGTYTAAWPWTGTTFGTRYSNPSYTTNQSSGRGAEFSPNEQYAALAHQSDNGTQYYYISAWPWSAGFGTRFSDPTPSTLAGLGQGNSVAWSNTNDAIALASQGSPYTNAFAFSSGGFGSKYANPSTLATDIAGAVVFISN